MALDCSNISVGFTQETCVKPAVPGTGSRVILLNPSDVDKGKSVVENNVIKSLILKKGKKGYEVDSLPDASVGEVTFTTGTYLNALGHSLTIRIFQKTEAAKAFGNGLINGKVIAIVENNERGDAGEVKYEVYGWKSGLKMSAITSTTEMADNTPYLFTLSTPSNGRESALPMSFFDTDEATTDAAVEALLTPAEAA